MPDTTLWFCGAIEFKLFYSRVMKGVMVSIALRCANVYEDLI